MFAAPAAQRPLARPWQRTVAEVAEADLGVDLADGLPSSLAAERLAMYGANRLGEDRGRSAWLVLTSQFTNAMSGVLTAAIVVTLLIGDVEDAVVIGAIVALNGVVGFIQEYRAERAMAALGRMAGERATVRRDGLVVEVRAADLVPGDLVLIAAGDVVPADVGFGRDQRLEGQRGSPDGRIRSSGQGARSSA